MARTESILSTLSFMSIQCGSSLLFGLGESHDSRIRLLYQIGKWRKIYSAPNPIAINWAVQHPLCGNDGKAGYRYDVWGIQSGEWLDVFRDFGEASVIYPLAGQKQPVLKEVREISDFYRERVFSNQ